MIKEMKMPQSCEECIFSDVYSYPPHYDDEYICGINYASMSYEQAKMRHVDCPLIEVPEHGRLIDADALIINLMDRGIEGLQTEDLHEIQQAIEDAPTVIPADKDGET